MPAFAHTKQEPIKIVVYTLKEFVCAHVAGPGGQMLSHNDESWTLLWARD